jgi:uncharacterized protein YjeT (DUF2065 family)
MLQLTDLFAALALVMIIEGVLPFLYPARFRDLLRRLDELDDRTVRIVGFVSMMIGVLLLVLVR